jgi:hypothetical protein
MYRDGTKVCVKCLRRLDRFLLLGPEIGRIPPGRQQSQNRYPPTQPEASQKTLPTHENGWFDIHDSFLCKLFNNFNSQSKYF